MMSIALFIVLLFSVSANTERVYQAADGFKAPELTLTAFDGSTVALSQLRGRYVLVSFWAAYDAESRIAASGYRDMASSMSEERFCLLSVNMDRSERLFREIVRRDNNNDEKTQFFVGRDRAGEISAKYHLDRGLQSYLIDPQGKIVAVNPSLSTLSDMLGA